MQGAAYLDGVNRSLLIYVTVVWQGAFYTPSRTVTKCGGIVKKMSASGYIEERLKTLQYKLSP